MKAKTNKIINMRLYMDAMRQLRLIGFISLGILLIISVLTPIGEVINMNQSNYANVPTVITTTRACYSMYLIFTIITPLLVLFLFSFLTKRNSSDYFHSFPITRGCLFNTYFSAVVTWIGIITIGSALVTGIAYGILSRYFVFSYGNLVRYSISIFICALLVAAAITIACAITGTLFTNIVVTGLILFFPRIILVIAVSVVTSNLNILVSSKILPLLDYNYNLIFNCLGKIVNSQNSNIYQVSAVIYTAILAIIYIVIGRFLFIKRKSETAANPSANRTLQCLIRIGISIPVCMIPLGTIFVAIIKKSGLSAIDLFWIVVLYLIAFAVMLLYELISTKKIQNVIKAMPSVALLAVANIFILLLLVGIYESQLNYEPKASDIKYVTVSNTDSGGNADYFEMKMSSKKITNQDLILLLSENLTKNIEYEKTNYPYKSATGNSNMNSSYNENSMKNDYNFVTVGFKTGLTVKYRRLYLDNSTYEKYVQLLLSSQDVKEFYLNLPEYDSNLMTFNNGLDAKQNEDIYNTLRDELKDVDYSKWYAALYNNGKAINMNWRYNVDDTVINTSLPLTTYTPKALLKYLNYVNAEKSVPQVISDVKTIIEKGDQFYDIKIQGYNEDFTSLGDGISITYKSAQSTGNKQALEVWNSLNTAALSSIDSISTENYVPVKLTIHLMNEEATSSSDPQYYWFFVLMKKEVFNELKSDM